MTTPSLSDRTRTAGRPRRGRAARYKAPRWLYGRAKGQGGYTLVEALVGMALFGIVIVAVGVISTSSWRAETRAYADQRAQETGRMLLHEMVYGDTDLSPPVKGALAASAVAVGADGSAFAYRVRWSEGETIHDDVVTYYLSGEEVFRSVADYTGTLTVVPTGGEAQAGNVEEFSVGFDGLLVSVSITITDPRGESVNLKTRVAPRNLPGG